MSAEERDKSEKKNRKFAEASKEQIRERGCTWGSAAFSKTTGGPQNISLLPFYVEHSYMSLN